MDTATDRASTAAPGGCRDGTCRLSHQGRRGADPVEPANRCEHFAQVRPIAPRTDGCEECMAAGVAWTELRVCLTCGHVGCCEDSPGRHAERHFHETGHPMICSYERLETWGWCYPHRRYFDPMPGPLPQRPYVWQQWWTKLFGGRPAKR